jgi:hypothetical protein
MEMSIPLVTPVVDDVAPCRSIDFRKPLLPANERLVATGGIDFPPLRGV